MSSRFEPDRGLKIDDAALDFLRRGRVGHLATADSEGRPSVVPICYVFDGHWLYSAIDQKPKSVPVVRLKRLRNLEENPRVSFVVDEYSDDWNKLAYVQVNGIATILLPDGDSGAEHSAAIGMLRRKYDQYRDMAIETTPIIKISPIGIRMWRFKTLAT